MNKRDLPENNKFFCDICDRGYKDEDKFKEHNDGHEKVGTSAETINHLVDRHELQMIDRSLKQMIDHFQLRSFPFKLGFTYCENHAYK